MGLLQEPTDVMEGLDPSRAILLQDEGLMQRVDECHSGDFVAEGHPDRCPSCGKIEPGLPYCRRCGHRIKRKAKDPGFCFQEVAGATQYQEALESIVQGAEREEDGGVHEWVTTVLVDEQSGEKESADIRVAALTESSAEIVGSIPQSDVEAIHKALSRVWSSNERLVACKALIQGGVRRQDGSSSAYGIRLLLPSARDIPKAVKVALAKR